VREKARIAARIALRFGWTGEGAGPTQRTAPYEHERRWEENQERGPISIALVDRPVRFVRLQVKLWPRRI
ncbi:MAG TPA: hypothetical protein PKY01_18495, partial [Candidatus Hydrogenedentes bacterium]|nr:hypothetical protein [Candidatus Hydrogenedentota bacterium]